jgi:hypothetical protein
MQGHGGAGSASSAAAATVAPLVQLKRAAREAAYVQQHGQALELRERALAAAELAAFPADSLVLASLRAAVAVGRTALPASAGDATTQAYRMAQLAAWARDANALAMARRALDALQRRAASDTLSPTPTEAAYFADEEMPADMQGAALLISVAEGAALLWPAASTLDDQAARLAGIHAALRAALALDARGAVARSPRTGQPWEQAQPDIAALRTSAHTLISELALDKPTAPPGHLRAALRARGLSVADEAALRAFATRHAPLYTPIRQTGLLHASQAALMSNPQAMRELAKHMFGDRYNADKPEDPEATAMFNMFCAGGGAQGRRPAARAPAPPQPPGDPRACALPSCGQVEPAPKAYKVCGRCRSVKYCCAEHQAQDWRRHKAGCSSAAA